MNYACIKLIDASVLLYFSFDSSFSQSRSMGQAVPTAHLTFHRLAAVIRDMRLCPLSLEETGISWKGGAFHA